MADSKRLAIMKALTTHLATTIDGTSGWQHDLSAAGRVVRGRKFINAKEPLPMVSIMENLNPDRLPSPVGQTGIGQMQKFEMNILVQGWAEDDKENPTDPAYNLMADVRKAIAILGNHNAEPRPAAHLLGGLVDDVRMEAGTVRPPEQATDLAFFWMHVIFSVSEHPADPYRLD
jgi:hypothetical protein